MPDPDDPDRSLSQGEVDRWVEVFLTSLRHHLWSANPRWNTRSEDLAIESVGVEGQYPDAEAVIVFRDARWPDCRFGYRWGPLWQDEPEFMGAVAWANFEEVRVSDVAADGHPTEITWLLEPSGCGWGQTHVETLWGEWAPGTEIHERTQDTLANPDEVAEHGTVRKYRKAGWAVIIDTETHPADGKMRGVVTSRPDED